MKKFEEPSIIVRDFDNEDIVTSSQITEAHKQAAAALTGDGSGIPEGNILRFTY